MGGLGMGMYLDVIDKPHVLKPVFVVSSVVGHSVFFGGKGWWCLLGRIESVVV